MRSGGRGDWSMADWSQLSFLRGCWMMGRTREVAASSGTKAKH
jgi:hypothetical protein